MDSKTNQGYTYLEFQLEFNHQGHSLVVCGPGYGSFIGSIFMLGPSPKRTHLESGYETHSMRNTTYGAKQVCIKVDIDASLPSSISVVYKGKIYEWRPSPCSHCKTFNNSTDKACSIKIKQV